MKHCLFSENFTLFDDTMREEKKIFEIFPRKITFFNCSSFLKEIETKQIQIHTSHRRTN